MTLKRGHNQSVEEARQVKLNIKTMPICFFDVSRPFRVFYLETLKRLRNSLWRKDLICGSRATVFYFFTTITPLLAHLYAPISLPHSPKLV